MLDVGSDLRRRKKVHRTTAERTAIVAESYEPGATVGGVARRHGISASQLSSWRTAARGKADQDKGPRPAFAEITLVEPLPAPFDSIEVVAGGVVIRLPKSTTPKRIADIAHVVSAKGQLARRRTGNRQGSITRRRVPALCETIFGFAMAHGSSAARERLRTGPRISSDAWSRFWQSATIFGFVELATDKWQHLDVECRQRLQ